MSDKPDYEKMWNKLRARLACNAEANHSSLGDYGRGWGDGFKAGIEEMDRLEAEAKGEHE